MSTVNTTSMVSMFATLGVSQISVVMVICLIALLSASQILPYSKLWNRRMSITLNLAIIPMVLTFILLVGYKVMVVMNH